MPRVRNFFAVAATAVLALAAIHEVDIELRLGEPLILIDDVLLFVVVVGGIVWYRVGDNADRPSWAPLGVVAAAFATQVLGMMIGGPATAGPNLGIGVMLLTVAGVFVWQAIRNR